MRSAIRCSGSRASHRRYGEYPAREDWVRYLQDYTEHRRIYVRIGTPVHKVTASPGGWQVETSDDALQARFVVIATGYDHDPDLPDWPGRQGYPGELIHSSAYRNPRPYRGRDVLVVGPNVTGSEVANQLARRGAARRAFASRAGPCRTWLPASSWA